MVIFKTWTWVLVASIFLFTSDVQANDKFKTDVSVKGVVFQDGQLNKSHKGSATVSCKIDKAKGGPLSIEMKMEVDVTTDGGPTVTLTFSENGKKKYSYKNGLYDINHKMRERYHSDHPPIFNLASLFYEILGGNNPVDHTTPLVRTLTPQDVDNDNDVNFSNWPYKRFKACAAFSGNIQGRYDEDEFVTGWLASKKAESEGSYGSLPHEPPVRVNPYATGTDVLDKDKKRK